MHGCTDKTSLDYAHFCSHAACALYELHEVRKGRQLIEIAVQTRTRLLSKDDGQLANAFNNKGLLELSECNYPEVLSLFKASFRIRKSTNNNYVSASYFLMGMTLIFMEEYQEAETELDQCARLCKEAGPRLDFMKSL